MQGILENYGVSDPRSIYTNVTSPGTGIVASSSVSIYTTDITSELLKALENLKK